MQCNIVWVWVGGGVGGGLASFPCNTRPRRQLLRLLLWYGHGASSFLQRRTSRRYRLSPRAGADLTHIIPLRWCSYYFYLRYPPTYCTSTVHSLVLLAPAVCLHIQCPCSCTQATRPLPSPRIPFPSRQLRLPSRLTSTRAPPRLSLAGLCPFQV
ncbi:hypothetical protein NA56DRAFT_238434 [Hyaloscypha hepaticicola]|uniref:Uncharacterized protein n=1 Tax=Hyaloscypha hepaticicola TaxID=2082293 RepID=A0A2J6QMJ3_9HELO|nr:hypothetical protein NA56DRAFT_238434 [Hyaloscypha hepaticicola]